MPRRKYKKHEAVVTDPIHNDPVIGCTINAILKRGKKSLAERLMYEALDIVGQRTGKDPVEVFHLAIKNLSPGVQVKSRRVGGATYQVPVEIVPARRQALAINWLLMYSREKKGASFPERMASEIIEASESKGAAFKKKLDTHKMAEANKAFSHYRF